MPLQNTSFDHLPLDDQYLELKRSLYRKFIKYLTYLIISIMIIEAFRAILNFNLAKLAKLPIPCLFALFTTRYLKHSHKILEVLCVVFTFFWNISSMWNNIHNSEGFIIDPLDAYYYGCATLLLERLCVEKIPNDKLKVAFGVLITLARLFIIRPPSIGVVLRHVSMSGLSMYLDLDKEKLTKDMFFSYTNYKNQLGKFKDLVVQDIPESIAIMSKDLMKGLFINESFKVLSKSTEISNIREYLNKLIIQAPNEEGNNISQEKDLFNQKFSLLNFLETKFRHCTDKTDQQKISFNLIYRKQKFSAFQTKQHIEEENYDEQIFEVKAFALTWDSEPAIAIIMHDITQQQTILGLQIADAQKDMVLATVSHELRTPLNGILGMIQIMQKSEKNKNTLQYLSICKSSSDLLVALVNSILDLNLIKDNKLRLDPKDIDLYDLLNDVLQMFEFQCKQKGLYIRLNISRNCPQFIKTDKNRLTQVLINLVGNALKFTLEGGIIISCEEDLSNHFIKFTIEDTGIGIRDQDKNKLFQILGGYNRWRKRVSANGVGLGLTISNSLVKLLAGSSEENNIKANSVHGKGSTFEFSIKRELELEDELLESENLEKSFDLNSFQEIEERIQKVKRHSMLTANNSNVFRSSICEPAPRVFTENSLDTYQSVMTTSIARLPAVNDEFFNASSPTIRTTKAYILLVDDNPFNIVVAERLISSHGYKVKTALSGVEAIRTVTENKDNPEKIRLIFMDIQMPIMDGYETTKRLRCLMENKMVEEIPIVALTANDRREDKEKCIRMGMCDHLGKPLKDRDLKLVLNKYIPRLG